MRKTRVKEFLLKAMEHSNKNKDRFSEIQANEIQVTKE
jgi:hypothetical protein